MVGLKFNLSVLSNAYDYALSQAYAPACVPNVCLSLSVKRATAQKTTENCDASFVRKILYGFCMQIEIKGNCIVLDSKALSKIHSVALIAIIVVTTVSGSVAYVLWSGQVQPGETIRIGICDDLDMPSGKGVWQAVLLAAEQVNAEGGVLGRNFTVVAEDNDAETSNDISMATNALTRLITVDKADYVITRAGLMGLTFQDICAEHKKILISVQANFDELSQRVVDNYDKYKYYFSMMPNQTSMDDGWVDAVLTLRNYTGFNKVAYLDQDASTWAQFRTGLCESLSEFGFDLVYQNSATWTTTDFTSYFAAIDSSGAEVLLANVYGGACVSFVKEWYDRQSPFVIWGNVGQVGSNFWETTDGKCEYTVFAGLPALAGYPFTNQTMPAREAYIQMWNGEIPTFPGTLAYDFVRFILPDAIRRAETTETEAIIKAIETTNVETCTARHFVFTSSHGVMIGSAGPNRSSVDYMLICTFQWQNGIQVPVCPEEILIEAGAIYKYPPWPGPWDNKQNP